MKMSIESTRFGTLEIDQDKLLNFPNGLAGFEKDRRFVILHEDGVPPRGDGSGQERRLREEEHVVHYLQCADDPDLTIPVVDPAIFGFDYDMTLTTDDLNLLEVKDGDFVAVLLGVSKYPRERYNENLPPRQNISANISGPILINTRSRIGMQKILVGLAYTMTFKEVEKLGTVSAAPGI